MQAVRVYHQRLCFFSCDASRSWWTGRALSMVCLRSIEISARRSAQSWLVVRRQKSSLRQLRGDEWRSSSSLFVCPSPPVSLRQSFQKPHEQICQADGGPAFSVSRGQHNLRSTMQRVWTSQSPNGESTQHHARPRFSEESLSVSTFCWAPSEELCIFYLSLEIRLDPDENIGLRAQTHRLARTHIHSRVRKWASFCCRKSRQLWREMGGTVGICICRWEKKLHLPQGSAVEMNQLSMVCRSDPILLITKSQNNKDQKVVGHAVCSSFVVP